MVFTEQKFRVIALLEATSFVALLVATYVKYGHDEPLGVQVLGPLHGLLFVAYVVVAVDLARRLRWPVSTTALVILAAVLPFGGYIVERWIVRGQRADPID